MITDNLKWIGHASFIIETKGKVIYLDPFNVEDSVAVHADAILITHPHHDHLSPNDISKIADSGTTVFVPKDSVDKIPVGNVIGVEPDKKYKFGNFEFQTVSAYNNVKERMGFHPKANGWVGYILNIDGKKFYHAGDTDHITEMKGLKTDMALLPIGGTYVMDVDQAIAAASEINGELFAPMHYKQLLGREGSRAAEEKFKKGVKNSVILKEIQEPRYSF